MQALKEQFQKYYTPKRCIINALIMFVAVLFFVYQRPEDLLYSVGFGCIGLLYIAGFIFLKTRQKN